MVIIWGNERGCLPICLKCQFDKTRGDKSPGKPRKIKKCMQFGQFIWKTKFNKLFCLHEYEKGRCNFTPSCLSSKILLIFSQKHSFAYYSSPFHFYFVLFCLEKAGKILSVCYVHDILCRGSSVHKLRFSFDLGGGCENKTVCEPYLSL